MALSITQRLTVLVALLSAAILAPAGIALHLSARQNIQAKSQERANALALMVRNIITRQLDEDILVDFGGEAIAYDKLKVPLDHWAIMRGDGSVEGALGMFNEHPSAVSGASRHGKRMFNGTPFIMAMVPLVPDKVVSWDSIPEAVRTVVSAKVQDGMFLNVKTEVSGDHNVIVVKWLLSDRIVEVAVTDAGQFVGITPEGLPDTLPVGMVVRTSSGQFVAEPRIVGWQAYNSELVAIVEGQLPNGQSTRAAVNRLGEQCSLRSNGSVDGILPASRLWAVVAYDMSHDMAETWQFDTVTLIGAMFVWLLMVLIAWQVTRHALKPVKEIVQRAERIRPSHLGERLPVGRADDELSRITRTVNAMLDRLEAGYRRERQFTGDVSHELRNPLAKMRVELDLALSESQKNPKCEEVLKRLGEYVEGMQGLTESLLMLARLEGRLERVEMERFDIADLAVEIINGFPEDFGRRVHLEVGESQGPLEVVGNRQMIGILLRNLLDNALRYGGSQSPVFLRIVREPNAVRVEVEDDGPGIPPDQVELAFNRFHRVEQSRSRQTGGMGLGLAIVKAIADLHDTSVILRSAAKRGTLVSFTLAFLDHPNNAPHEIL